jgi:ABC-type nickel/cobalt efflux system permease component RcnA
MFIKRMIIRKAAFLLLISGATAFAHPMGNFSISHYTGIHISTDSVELEYLIDMAEIPAFQEMQQSAITSDPEDPAVKSYLASKASDFARNLFLALNSHAATLVPMSQHVIFPAGAGNLPTMKMAFVYRAALPESCKAKSCSLNYADRNFPGRAGWKEIVVSTATGVHPEGNAFVRDRSSRLTDYPTDLVNSPPQDTAAEISFKVPVFKPVKPLVSIAQPGTLATPAVQKPVDLKPNRQSSPRNAFSELMTHRDISFGFAFLAALIAAGLGALHALEPGHGKTIVAAYLVGSKGTARHALLLGLIVTISHTAGVYLLGAVTLYAQKYIMPDRIYPFLSVISGILIAGMGIYILLKRTVGENFSLGQEHGPNGHTHGIPWPRAATEARDRADQKFGKRQLMILGITGGMVPCPAALVVLLSAVALHRVGFGLFLILAFSLGLAAVLIGMGLTAVYAGKLLSKTPVEGKLIRVWMPAASAVMITILGIGIVVDGLSKAGIAGIRI